MPVLGAYLAIIVIPAIAAAHQAAYLLKTRRQRMESRLPESIRIDKIETTDIQHRMGNLPSNTVAWLIATLWIVLLCAALLRLRSG